MHGGRAGPGLLHPGDPRGEDAPDRPGDAQRADLPDVDVPVRRLRRVRGDDQLPQARVHLHPRLREPDARGVRGTDGQPRGDRVGVLVLVGDGGDARGVHDARGDRGPDRLQQRALRRRLLAVHEGHAAVRRHGRPGGSARPGRGRRRAPGRGVLLRRDDREPQRHRRGPRGAGRALSRERCAGRRRQHVRVAVPGQPVALGVRVRAALGDEVHRGAQRPDRRRGVRARATPARRSATPRSTPGARWRRSRRGSACAGW